MSRGEGAWYSRNNVFFACSNGGDARLGQIFELKLYNNDAQILELLFESTQDEAMGAPDNICVTPYGNNIIVCEDGSGAEYLHLLRRSGNQVYRLAENRYPGQEAANGQAPISARTARPFLPTCRARASCSLSGPTPPLGLDHLIGSES